MVIVGNKCDLENEREVPPEDGRQVRICLFIVKSV